MFEGDDSPTRRIYRTDVGTVDFDRAEAIAMAVARGDKTSGDFELLHALFAVALRHEPARAVRARALLERLRTRVTPIDMDALWQLLFAIFKVAD